jgi:hypothetical protein
MEEVSKTFPTLRRWRAMSENEQDALLDRIELRRRWRAVRARVMVAILCVAAVAVGAMLVAAP